jgi:hypothetical protein
MRRRAPLRRCLGALATGLVLFIAPVASSDDQKDVAVSLCKEALQHVRDHDYEAARALYAKAYALTPTASVLFNLALAELHSSHSLDALRHFRLYIKDPAAEPPKVAVVNAELLPRAQAETGHIALDEAPRGAVVYLDDSFLGETASPIDVIPGRHLVTARTQDGGWLANVDAPAGTLVTAKFRIVFAAPARPWPPRGHLRDGGTPARAADGTVGESSDEEARL